MKSGVPTSLALGDAKAQASIVKASRRATILIADGHHRYEVSPRLHERERAPGAETVLAYLCPRKTRADRLPTHRVVESESRRAWRRWKPPVPPCAEMPQNSLSDDAVGPQDDQPRVLPRGKIGPARSRAGARSLS